MVTADAAGVRRQLLSGAPTPIDYDTQGTRAEVLAEDTGIESYPLRVSAAATRIMRVDAMFAGTPVGKATPRRRAR